MSEEQLLYVYAVGRDDHALDRMTCLLTGVDGHALRLVGGHRLVAVVSAVPADRFGQAGLAAQLEDLGRLEGLARAHHAVVDAAFAEATVLPMRLATVYRDEAGVAAVLEDRHAYFEETLRVLEGHVEMGVKVYAVPEASPAPPETEPPASTPGRAYLRRRQTQRNTVRRAYDAASELADAVVDKADALARARAVHRPQQGEWSEGRGENVANESYLVPLEAVEEFREELSGLARGEQGVSVEVTGPWAPYSFATAPETAPERA
ncbi:GvpL/GvpF family gas vesicle protein [Streptomyces sp. NPDC048664]|uniref:GvpL/GvpF family gas vesicle protein n=1 Tax=Streptomyces sp. NPDC048664 TaxID=3154505 RepID=UPI00343D84F1